MSGQWRAEQARTEREAQDALPHRVDRGSKSEAIRAAMATYLAGEHYRSQDRRKSVVEEDTSSTEAGEPPAG
jgi:hypothetical protein